MAGSKKRTLHMHKLAKYGHRITVHSNEYIEWVSENQYEWLIPRRFTYFRSLKNGTSCKMVRMNSENINLAFILQHWKIRKFGVRASS